MIIEEIVKIKKFKIKHTFSDQNKKIMLVGNDFSIPEAFDFMPCTAKYIETEEDLEEPLQPLKGAIKM